MSSFMAVDPSTGHELAELPETTPAQVAEMVAAARRALAAEEAWRTPSVRAGALSRLARRVEDDGEALAELECRDTGEPLSRARADVAATVRHLDRCAGSIERGLAGRTIPLGPGLHHYTVREPWGACAQIITWHHALRVAARCAAPALAAGNAVILKPSELASLTPLRLAEHAEAAGVPRGLLQVATGAGETGAALVDHPGVHHVTFVGSAATGVVVGQACARRLVPFQLEPGGTSAHVVFAGADLDLAVPAVAGALIRSGSAGTRLLVEQGIYDDVVARASAALESVSVGPALEDPQLGPLISAGRLERALGMLAGARAAGATVVTGGEPVGGRFLRPTLVTGVRPDWPILQAEVSGPVLYALPFADEGEAVALAGSTAAGVWTPDLARAHRVAAAVRAGHVFVNGSGVERPCGGAEGLEAYTRVKHIGITL